MKSDIILSQVRNKIATANKAFSLGKLDLAEENIAEVLKLVDHDHAAYFEELHYGYSFLKNIYEMRDDALNVAALDNFTRAIEKKYFHADIPETVNQKKIREIREQTAVNLQRCSLVKTAPYPLGDNGKPLKTSADKIMLQELASELMNELPVAEIYRDCNQRLRNFFKEIVADVETKAGPVPHGAKYAIVAFGSLARSEATPFSDLEFGILIGEEIAALTPKQREQVKNYFRQLATNINIEIINLGETTIAIQNIPSIKSLQSPTPNGLSCDGRDAKSCKTPLGNVHHIAPKMAKKQEELEDENLTPDQVLALSDELIEIENSQFELIMTPSEMAQLHDEEWYRRDRHLSTALMTSYFIAGSHPELTDEYKIAIDRVLNRPLILNPDEVAAKEKSIAAKHEEAKVIHDSLPPMSSVFSPEQIEKLMGDQDLTFQDNLDHMNALSKLPPAQIIEYMKAGEKMLEKERMKELPTLRQQRGMDLLLEAVSRFQLKAGKMENGSRNFSPKYDFYRPVMMFIDHLALLLDAPGRSIWERFDSLFIGDENNPAKLKLQNVEGQKNLKWLFDISMLMRLQNYTSHQTQKEEMFLLDVGESKLLTAQQRDIIGQGQAITKETLFEIYSVLREFYSRVKAYVEDPLKRNPAIYPAMFNSYYYDNDDFSKADIYEMFEDYSKALEHYKKFVQFTKPDSEIAKKNIAMAYNNMAYVYNKLGHYRERDNCLNEAEEIFGRTSDPLGITHNLSSMACAKMSEGQFVEAINLEEKSLQMRRAQFGNDSLLVAQSLSNLGDIYAGKNEFKMALQKYDESLAIKQTKLDPADPSLLQTLVNLTIVCDACGLYKKAENLYKSNLANALRIYGDTDPYTGKCQLNLAAFYSDRENHVEAANCVKKAYAIFKDRKDFPEDKANTLHLLGTMSYRSGNLDEAINWYQEAKNIRESIVGLSPNYLANSLNAIAGIRCKQKNFTEAEKLYEQAIAISTATKGEINSSVAIYCYQLSITYFDQEKFNQAFDSCKKSIGITQELHDINHPDLIKAHEMLSVICNKVGKTQEAKDAINEAKRICVENNMQQNDPVFIRINKQADWQNRGKREASSSSSSTSVPASSAQLPKAHKVKKESCLVM